MADSTLNRFVASGTTAERLAFTPTPPTPASGPAFGYVWFDTTDELVYAWNGSSWVVALSSGTVTNTGTLTSGDFITGNGGVDVTAVSPTAATALLDDLVGDSGSGGTKGLAPAPASGDAAAGKFLKADGTWTVPPGAGAVSILTLLTADPVSPSDDTAWVVRIGTSPTMTIAMKARVAGVTYTIASITA